MTEVPVALGALVSALEALIADAVGRMPNGHKRFLLSFETGAPEWSLLDVTSVERLPAVQWRLENLARLDGRMLATLPASFWTTSQSQKAGQKSKP